MRKNNISGEKLWTPDFLRMCLANFLLFVSVYLMLPVLPILMGERLGVSVVQVASLLGLFVGAMLLVGPFHAYLGDHYKRKEILLYALLLLLASSIRLLFVCSFGELLLLFGVQGACFSLAATAGITVTIDITASSCRSAGNMVYALAARLGMLIGVGAGVGLYALEGFETVAYLAILCIVLAVLLVACTYVAFRAPIGVGHCSFDRFLLLRGWLPAMNLILIALVPGLLIPLLIQGDFSALFLLVGLIGFAISFTKKFVGLSYHCQRGTANTTCHLSMEIGLLIGVWITYYCLETTSVETVYRAVLLTALLSLLFFFLLTRPYYRKNRVK